MAYASLVLRSRSAAGAGVALAFRFVALGLGMVATLLLTRTLTVSQVGIYSWALAWMSIFQMAGSVGFDRLVVREVAAAGSTQDGRRLASVVRTANLVVGCASGLIVLVGGVLGALAVAADSRDAFLIAAAITPICALSAVRQGVVQGAGRVGLSRFPEDVLRPIAFVVLLAAGLSAADDLQTAAGAMGLQAGAVGVSFAAGVWIQHRTLRRWRPTHMGQPRVDAIAWIRQAAPLGLVAGLGVALLQIDVVLLGLLSDSTSVGVYAVSVKVALFVGLAEWAANAAFLPLAARLYALADATRLRLATQLASAGALAGTLILALPLLIVPQRILSLFGPAFESGSVELRLLGSAWLVSALGGLNGSLLAMTGRTTSVVRGSAIALAVNVAANIALIPMLASKGAAISWVLTLTVWNVYLAVVVRRSFGFWASPVGLLGSLVRKRQRT